MGGEIDCRTCQVLYKSKPISLHYSYGERGHHIDCDRYTYWRLHDKDPELCKRACNIIYDPQVLVDTALAVAENHIDDNFEIVIGLRALKQKHD